MAPNLKNVDNAKAVLEEIKPFCSAFVTCPQVPLLRQILMIIDKVPDHVLQEIHIPVLFPFIIVLEKKNKIQGFSEELHSGVLHLLSTVFKRTTINNADLFLETMTIVTYQLFNKETNTLIPNIDEKITKSVLDIIMLIGLHVNKEIRYQIYNRSNAPQIAHCLFVCNQIAINEKKVQIRLAAINCLMSFCTVHDEQMKKLHSPNFDPKLLKCVGDLLMFVLPGILAGLKTVAKGDITQSHIVTYTSIKAISRIISLCMHDSTETTQNLTNEDFVNLVSKKVNPDSGAKNTTDTKSKKRDPSAMKEHLNTAKKDAAWYQNASEKLVSLIQNITPLHSHNHEKVRLEVARLCSDMFTYCPRNMEPSLKYILEVTIALSEDNDPEVAKIAKNALDLYVENSHNWNGRQLSEIVVENFNSLLSRVPRLLNSLNLDNQLNSGLNLLKGYVNLLTMGETGDQKLVQIISSPIVMNRFVVTLMEIFKMDSTSVNLLDDCSIRDIEDNIYTSTPWRRFVYLDSEKNIQSALKICKSIGKSDAAELVVNYLLDFLDGSGHDNLKEAILLLNEITIASKEHLIENVISAYYEQDNWYLPIKVARSEKSPGRDETLDVNVYNPRAWSKNYTPGLFEGAVEMRYTDISLDNIITTNNVIEECEEGTCRTLTEAKNNVICVCLMVEGVGKMARVLGDKFEMHLLKSLYLVLERAGNSNEMIHLAGLQSLKDISDACGLRSITELIKENSDYFSHHVNLKLRKIGEDSGVLDVLLIVMKYSEASVLPCLYEILENVMTQCFNPLEKNNYDSFLKLFLTFVNYVKTKFPHKTETDVVEIKTILTVEEIRKQLSEYHHQRSVLRNAYKCEEEIGKSGEEMWNEDMAKKNDEELETMETDEPLDKPIPPHIKMVASILKKTLNFIPANERSRKLLALDIMKEGFLVIRHYENELLPLVHQVWSPLVSRFRDTDSPLIINKSFKLLAVLAEVSKDFIQARTVKEVLPSMCAFLKNSAKESHSKTAASSYQYSQLYKLQISLLEELGDLCISLRLHVRQVYEVMSAAQVFLSSKQPKTLQNASIKLFKKLLDYDTAHCWLHLSGLYNDLPAISKIGDFVPCKPQNEYHQNVQLIFM